jgi:hypothetical protein
MQPIKAAEARVLRLSVVNIIQSITAQRVRDVAGKGLFSYYAEGIFCPRIFLEFLADLWSPV